MLEKKTTKQIIQESESYLDFPILDDKLIIGQDLPLRVWVSQESLNSLLEDMGMYLDIYYDEKSDKDAIIHNLKIIYEELKGEKE